jgi:multimeric flavodoxin WrbA
MIIRKLGSIKPKVILFQGSPRDKDTCPNMNSKSHKIVDYIIDKWSPFIDFKVFDLAVNQSKAPTIQPCKGCVSTAGGFHCHMSCSCYFKGDTKKPDLLKELNVYEHLEECDAFVIISPIHWYSLTSQIKLLFDRLVCINQTLTVDDAKKLMGSDNIKNSDITGKFSKSGKYDEMLRNHLEGKICGFYVHGDDGADDYSGKELPDSYSDVIKDNFSVDPKSVVMPYVIQMKYSGVFAPDELIQAFYVNKGIDYYTANQTVNQQSEFFERADTLMDNLLNYLDKMKDKNDEY